MAWVVIHRPAFSAKEEDYFFLNPAWFHIKTRYSTLLHVIKAVYELAGYLWAQHNCTTKIFEPEVGCFNLVQLLEFFYWPLHY